MGAVAVPPTPQTVTLRTFEKNVPFRLDFSPDVAPGDAVSSAQIAVFAQPTRYQASAPMDVTSALLMSQSSTGSSVSMVLGNANATLGTTYTVRVVATMVSGMTLQETIENIVVDQ